jgi:hypothetical protein
MNNPLTTLGIDPALLRGVDIENARIIVRAVTQALLKVSHPDQVSGNRDRFEKVQAIQPLLKDDALFAQSLEDFLKPRRDKVSRLLEENMALQAIVAEQDARAEKFILAGQSPCLTVRSKGPYVVHLIDVTKASSGSFHTHARCFVTLEVGECDTVTVTVGTVAKQVNRHLVGTVAPNENIKQLMRDCQPELFDSLRLGRRLPGKRKNNFSQESESIGSHMISVKDAKPILQLLQPSIDVGSFLFSGTSVGGEDYLYFEGRVYQPTRARS